MKPSLNHMRWALQFLTRLPVGRTPAPTNSDMAHASLYFPLVGLILGAILWVAHGAAAHLWAHPFPQSAVLVFILVMATGAFHEDGLADTADGFGGAFDKIRKLEIMKDSRVGTYGGMALVLSTLLRTSFLTAMDPAVWVPIWTAGLAVGRWAALPLIVLLPYARAESKPLIEGVDWQKTLTATALTLLILWALVPNLFFDILVMSFLLLGGAYYYSRKQINGITGDTLGATNIVLEISVLAIGAHFHPA